MRQNEIYNNLIQILEDKVTEDCIEIEIIRRLTENDGNTYSMIFKLFNKIDDFNYIITELSEKIVTQLPPILYSDDFNDILIFVFW